MSLLQTALAMDPVTIVAFMGAALILYLTPGADMMFTLATGISSGPKAGFAAACGISLGVLTHALIAAIGIAALFAATPLAFDAIRLAGAAYLGWLAWNSWRTHSHGSGPKQASHIRTAFRRGFITNMLNPKVALFVLAFLPQFTDPAIGPVSHQIIILGLLLATGGVITDGAYGIAAGRLAHRLRNTGSAMNRISGAVFATLAARIAWDVAR